MTETVILTLLNYVADLEKLAEDDVFDVQSHADQVPYLRENFKLDEPSEKNLASNIEEDANLFMKLPTFIQHKVLKKLDHKNLIKFAKAYPNYIQTCINPVYWKTIDQSLGSKFLTVEEARVILKHLNKHLLRLDIDFEHYNEIEDYDKLFDEFLNYTRNLSILHVYHRGPSNFVSIMNKYINGLTSIRIDWDGLNSDHIIGIANTQTRLDSFAISTFQEVDKGLEYIIERFESFVSFRFKVNSLREE